jgi:hypothetical protein
MFLPVVVTLLVQAQPTCKPTDVCWLVLPGKAASEIECLPAAFSPAKISPALLGSVVSVGLGCTVPIPEAVEGSVALIQRGGCSFGQKVLNVQKSGAIGAMIYDNVNTSPLLLQAPGTVFNRDSSTYSVHDDKKVPGQIMIPVVSLTKSEGERLAQLTKAAAGSSETFVSVEYDATSCEEKPARKTNKGKERPESEGPNGKRPGRHPPGMDTEEQEERIRLRLENVIIGDSIVTKVAADHFDAEVVRLHRQEDVVLVLFEDTRSFTANGYSSIDPMQMTLLALLKSADAFETKFNSDNEVEIKFALVCTDELNQPSASVPTAPAVQVFHRGEKQREIDIAAVTTAGDIGQTAQKITAFALQSWFELANTEDEQQALEMGGRSPVSGLQV